MRLNALIRAQRRGEHVWHLPTRLLVEVLEAKSPATQVRFPALSGRGDQTVANRELGL